MRDKVEREQRGGIGCGACNRPAAHRGDTEGGGGCDKTDDDDVGDCPRQWTWVGLPSQRPLRIRQ
jgi:hypothetical protein